MYNHVTNITHDYMVNSHEEFVCLTICDKTPELIAAMLRVDALLLQEAGDVGHRSLGLGDFVFFSKAPQWYSMVNNA